MPIADDWDIDYANQEIRHVDGILTYAANTGTAPALNDYVIGGTSGAVSRVIAGSDLGGTDAAGTLTLTNVIGRFIDTETLRVLSEVPFDTVGGSPDQGFKIGDTITGPTTESIDVQAIEYNQGPKVTTAGEGSIYGDNLTSGFSDGEQLDVSGGSTAVADVNGSESDNSALFPTCTVNGTLAVPGTADTNDSVIIHYNAGSIAIPEDAKIADASTAAFGFAQQVVGVLATGSVRIVDYDSTGVFTDTNGLQLEDVVFYDTQVAGEVFLEGDVIEGATSLERFRVLAVIDDGDSSGKLITAGKTGTLTNLEVLRKILPGNIVGNNVANVENLTEILACGTINIPDGIRTEQRDSQGGIYGTSVSLNIRRSVNAFFSYLQDTFDELSDLDDKPPMDGTFKDTVYEILSSNGWEIPDLSMRFLEKGGMQDSNKDNIWTNHQSIMSRVISANGFIVASGNPTPHPNAYIEQNDNVLPQFWLEGDFNVLVKAKTTSDVEVIDPSTPALGQLIDSGTVTWFLREYGDSYDHFDTSQVGSVATIPLSTANDSDNNTGTDNWTFNTGGAGAFTVGEEIRAPSGAVGIVTASDTGATGTVEYILKTTQVFQDADVITGQVSAKSATLDGAGDSTVVAGYGTNVRTMVQDTRFTGGTTTVALFIVGEVVNQAGSSYVGYVLEDDTGNIYTQDAPATPAPSATGQLTGATSGALNTPTGTNDQATVPKDLGDGSGDLNYSGVTSSDITGGAAQTIQVVYEWDKFLTRAESLLDQGGVSTATGVEGRLYRGFVSTYTENKAAPYGNFAGGIMFGAQGHFIDKDTLVAGDLQNIRLIPNSGPPVLVPPNLQSIIVSNLLVGFRASVYRSTGASSEDILTTEFQLAAGNVAANSVIVVQAGARGISPLPSDVPDTGVLRVEDPSVPGTFLRAIYDSVNLATNTFSLQQGIGQNTIGDITGAVDLIQTDDCFVVFIEEEAVATTVSNSVLYVGDVNLVITARWKGFKHFIAASVFTTSGASVGIVRTPDPTVNLP